MTTTQMVHSRLYRSRGLARDHLCVGCGKPARDWAYQHTATNEQVDEHGQRWSENLDDYAPMCRRCHSTFDHQKTPEAFERQKEIARAVPVEVRQAAGRAAIALRPDTAITMHRRTCECGYESNAGNVAQHRRRLNHMEVS